MNRILLIPTLFTVAACATPGIEPGQTEMVQTAEPVQSAEPAPTAARPQGAVTGDDNTVSQSMIVQNDAAEGTHGIEDIEAPNVAETPAAMIPGKVEPEDQIVCEWATPTGSRIPRKICRDRAEIAKKSEYDQEMFDDIKRNTAIGNTRL